MVVSRCGAVICLALLAGLSGCSSLFTPRPHKLMSTTSKMVGAAKFPATLPRELSHQVLPPYRVAPGDVLLVQPVDFNSSLRLPADQKVQPDGTIELSKYRRLVVTDMTLDEIKSAVEEQVSSAGRRGEEVEVRLTEPESQVYYVIGEVNSPGSYPLIGREMFLDAVLSAGGLSDRADRHNIILSRPSPPQGCRTVLPICYRHVVQLGDTSTNYQIMPGDRIYVPSLSFTSQVLRTIFPFQGERCPQCAAAQVPCPSDAMVFPERPIVALAEKGDRDPNPVRTSRPRRVRRVARTRRDTRVRAERRDEDH